MQLQNRIFLGENQEEVLDREQEGLTYVCYDVYLDHYPNREVTWHWHSFLEMTYVIEGNIEYSFPEKNIVVHAGELIFINSSVLHRLVPYQGEYHTHSCDIIFDHHLLSGTYHSNLEHKYFLPIISNANLPFYVIRPDDMENVHMIHEFLCAIDADKRSEKGYEFEVQHHLANVWLTLYDKEDLHPDIRFSKNDIGIERLKCMMNFIRQNYSNKLDLEQIAASASISKRECSRCFQKNLRISPMDYLKKYRIDQAANMLLHTSESVLSVSESCGFSSGSYFSKVFLKEMHLSPKEYQKQKRINQNE